MGEAGNASQFWSQQSQVEAFPASTEPLAYELALLDHAALLSRRSGEVSEVHVVGVGAGRELSATRKVFPEARIKAWDIAAPMVESCRRHIESAQLRDVTVAQSDVADLSAEDGPADVVVLVNAILCYVDNPVDRRRTAAALQAVLRPGGTIAAVVHQRNGRPDWSLWFALRAAATRLGVADGRRGDRRIEHDAQSMLFHHYTPSEMRELLTRSGFDRVDVRSLRSWARATGHTIPVRSPNPLMILARRPV